MITPFALLKPRGSAGARAWRPHRNSRDVKGPRIIGSIVPGERDSEPGATASAACPWTQASLAFSSRRANDRDEATRVFSGARASLTGPEQRASDSRAASRSQSRHFQQTLTDMRSANQRRRGPDQQVLERVILFGRKQQDDVWVTGHRRRIRSGLSAAGWTGTPRMNNPDSGAEADHSACGPILEPLRSWLTSSPSGPCDVGSHEFPALSPAQDHRLTGPRRSCSNLTSSRR